VQRSRRRAVRLSTVSTQRCVLVPTRVSGATLAQRRPAPPPPPPPRNRRPTTRCAALRSPRPAASRCRQRRWRRRQPWASPRTTCIAASCWSRPASWSCQVSGCGWVGRAGGGGVERAAAARRCRYACCIAALLLTCRLTQATYRRPTPTPQNHPRQRVWAEGRHAALPHDVPAARGGHGRGGGAPGRVP
jgi:hypothetical protein